MENPSTYIFHNFHQGLWDLQNPAQQFQHPESCTEYGYIYGCGFVSALLSGFGCFRAVLKVTAG